MASMISSDEQPFPMLVASTGRLYFPATRTIFRRLQVMTFQRLRVRATERGRRTMTIAIASIPSSYGLQHISIGIRKRNETPDREWICVVTVGRIGGWPRCASHLLIYHWSARLYERRTLLPVLTEGQTVRPLLWPSLFKTIEASGGRIGGSEGGLESRRCGSRE